MRPSCSRPPTQIGRRCASRAPQDFACGARHSCFHGHRGRADAAMTHLVHSVALASASDSRRARLRTAPRMPSGRLAARSAFTTRCGRVSRSALPESRLPHWLPRGLVGQPHRRIDRRHRVRRSCWPFGTLPHRSADLNSRTARGVETCLLRWPPASPPVPRRLRRCR